MPLFKVTILEEYIKTINIEAPTKEEAYTLVWDELYGAPIYKQFKEENVIDVQEIK